MSEKESRGNGIQSGEDYGSRAIEVNLHVAFRVELSSRENTWNQKTSKNRQMNYSYRRQTHMREDG